MPLIVVCGRPCVGKTSFSRALLDALVSSGARASLVSAEEGGGGSSFCGDRARVFADAPSEKAARAWLRAAVERALTDAQLVVVADCGAGVKGFRYELFCAARNVGARSAVVWVGPDVLHGAARAVNAERRAREVGGATAYADAALDGLWARFESPDARNRWDSPLVRVNLATPSARASDALLAAAAARGQLPLESGGDGGGAFWERAAQRAPLSADVVASPFLTSRFELRQVFSAAALATEQGAGAAVEATVGATRRRARQAADALAGYGDVPTHGFSRTSVARERSAPDYFADNFNADTGSENGDDIANLRDFDGIDEARGAEDDNGAPAPPPVPPPISVTVGLGSFRRPARASATVAVSTGTGSLVVAPAGSAAATEVVPMSTGVTDDAVMAAITWLVGFAHGRSSDATTRVAAAAVEDSAPIYDEDSRTSAASISATVLASLDGRDLSAPGVFETVGVSFRLPRGTSTQELARLRRAYLQPANDVGKGDAAAFIAFCYKALRQRDEAK